MPPMPTAKQMMATYCSMLLIPPRFKMVFKIASSIWVL